MSITHIATDVHRRSSNTFRVLVAVATGALGLMHSTACSSGDGVGDAGDAPEASAAPGPAGAGKTQCSETACLVGYFSPARSCKEYCSPLQGGPLFAPNYPCSNNDNLKDGPWACQCADLLAGKAETGCVTAGDAKESTSADNCMVLPGKTQSCRAWCAAVGPIAIGTCEQTKGVTHGCDCTSPDPLMNDKPKCSEATCNVKTEQGEVLHCTAYCKTKRSAPGSHATCMYPYADHTCRCGGGSGDETYPDRCASP